MAYIGNQPASAFASTEKQTITGNGTTGPYALTHEVAAATDIACFVNNVRQEPGVAYTVSGNQMTMTGNVASTDDFYVVYIGRVVGTVNHPANAPLSATTGTFTGDLTVDTNTLKVDAANNRVGVGTSPAAKLHVAASGNFNQTVRVEDTSVSGRRLDFSYNSTGPYIWVNNSEPLNIYTGGSTRFQIDASGRVTKPSQPYFFAKTGRAGDGYTDDPYQFRNVVHNVGGHFKTSSGTGQWSRFTAPVGGKYLFTAFPAYLQAGVNFSVRITVNGGVQGELARFIQGSAASHCGFTCSTILNLSVNDYVELQAGYTPYHLNTTTNFFSGMLIG